MWYSQLLTQTAGRFVLQVVTITAGLWGGGARAERVDGWLWSQTGSEADQLRGFTQLPQISELWLLGL